MRQAILPSAKLVPFLEQLRRAATLVAPVVAEGGPILAEVSSAEQAAGAAAVLAAADGSNTRLSLKGTFFPQREVLFSFAAGSLEEVPGTGSGNAPPLVVFGARPCDARWPRWAPGCPAGRSSSTWTTRRTAGPTWT